MSNNKLSLTKSMLEAPKTLHEVFDLEAFKNSFITNYEKMNGLPNGELVFEREKVLFMQRVMNDPKKSLQKCNRLSIYSSFVELAASNLTLADDQAYIISYGEVATFQIGWKGRLAQISRMPGIQEVNEPQVVYQSDDFDYTLAPRPAIIKHKRERQRPDDDEITHVYITYTTNIGVDKCLILEAHEVNRTMEHFSPSYIKWKKSGGKWPDGNKMEDPFPLAFPDKYFKKTCVKRLYDSLPKTNEMRDFDDRLASRPDVDEPFNAYTVIDEPTGDHQSEPEIKQPANDHSDAGTSF